PRSYDETATTGRGLELVAAVSFDHGVKALGADGKVVWCCVNSEFAQSVLELSDDHEDWSDLVEDGQPGAVESAPDALVVNLLGLPPTLWLAAREHHDALLRELALVQGSLPGEQARALAEDLTAADSARTRISDA